MHRCTFAGTSQRVVDTIDEHHEHGRYTGTVGTDQLIAQGALISSALIGSLVAGKITAGYMSTARISGATLSGVTVNVNTNLTVGNNIYLKSLAYIRTQGDALFMTCPTNLFISIQVAAYTLMVGELIPRKPLCLDNHSFGNRSNLINALSSTIKYSLGFVVFTKKAIPPISK